MEAEGQWGVLKGGHQCSTVNVEMLGCDLPTVGEGRDDNMAEGDRDTFFAAVTVIKLVPSLQRFDSNFIFAVFQSQPVFLFILKDYNLHKYD